jgi:hypothetical protein
MTLVRGGRNADADRLGFRRKLSRGHDLRTRFYLACFRERHCSGEGHWRAALLGLFRRTTRRMAGRRAGNQSASHHADFGPIGRPRKSRCGSQRTRNESAQPCFLIAATADRPSVRLGGRFVWTEQSGARSCFVVRRAFLAPQPGRALLPRGPSSHSCRGAFCFSAGGASRL